MVYVACRPPAKQELTKWIKFLINQIKALGIDVRLSQEGTAETLQALKPDVIIAATGGTEIIPPIDGLRTVKTCSAVDLLTGNDLIMSGNVLIIGGGIVALETADFLTQNIYPTKITIMEMLDDVGKEYYPARKKLVLNNLASKGVEIKTLTSVKRITENGVIADVAGKETNFWNFTNIVIACGFRSSYVGSYYEGLSKELYVIGDAVKPRLALHAIAEAAALARQI